MPMQLGPYRDDGLLPYRPGCTYKMRCDAEATTTVLINGKERPVCEACKRRELTEQNTVAWFVARRLPPFSGENTAS